MALSRDIHAHDGPSALPSFKTPDSRRGGQ
jgi:hypothetical protein